MRPTRLVALATLLGAALAGRPDVTARTAASKTRPHVEVLTSDKLEGRLTGSPGERLAGDYIIEQLKKAGAKPLPGRSDYPLPFDFTAGTKDGGSIVTVTPEGGTPTSFPARTDVQALSFSDNGEVTAPLVFAGYGIVVPAGQSVAYDSYAGLDVKDKIALVLRYFPEEAEPKTKAMLARYSDLRYKAMAARQRGAKALLVVTGPNSPNAGEVIPMSFDTALAGSGLVAASVSRQVADAIFPATADRGLAAVQKSLDDANPHAAGFAISGLTLTVRASVLREKQTGRNIVAYLPATTGTPLPSKPWIAVGAHYDHLGRGRAGNSLARQEEIGQIHHGADDNASGTAALLALVAEVATQARPRHVLVTFWSGEEMGLLGSAAYVAAPPIPNEQVEAYINFDMVGRMQDNKLTVQAVGTSDIWSKMLEQANVAAGFDLQIQPDPYQPTDVASFNQAGVPCLTFFTGTHTDYHRPTDTAEKINYEDLDRIVDFVAAIAKRVGALEQAPAFVKVQQQVQSGGGRAGVRVFTGTIPDYAGDAKGLLLSGVVGGGPAEQAGLQKGDVIVEIAGQSITNIYDYTYALELLKIGQPAKVVYLRGGERREATLTPGARK